MRDPARMDSILRKFEEAWKAYPDLRFAQLLWALSGGKDPFYMEDDILERNLDDFLRKAGK